MKTLTTIVAALIAMTDLMASAFAFGPGWGRGHGGGTYDGYDPAVLSQLNLTAEQTIKINAFREAFLKDSNSLRDKIFSKRSDWMRLWLQRRKQTSTCCIRIN